MQKTPIMMSALVCPGLGQFMQGRKIAGAIFLILILIPFIAVMTFFFTIIIAICRHGFDLSADPGGIMGRFAGLLISFIIALIVYVISLFDTIRASKTPPPLPKT